MKRGLWNKIVEEFGANSPDTEIWPTFYGEALIMGYKSELWDRLDYAAKVGCRNLVLNSNGTLLDRWDNIKKFSRRHCDGSSSAWTDCRKKHSS